MRIIIEIEEGVSPQATTDIETMGTATATEVQSAGSAATEFLEETIPSPPEPVTETTLETAAEVGIEDAGAAPGLEGEADAEIASTALPEVEDAESAEVIDAGGAPMTLEEEETP